MSSRISTLLKLLLLAPLLVSARPNHPLERSNSDSSTSGKRLASHEQITPYPILWPYPSIPPRYHTPTDPRNEETRWGNPVELQQPDHTRGSKQDPAGNPAQHPDHGMDWWAKNDANRTGSQNGPTSVARVFGREARLTNDYREFAKLPTPVVHSGVLNFTLPATDDIVATDVALLASVMAANDEDTGSQAKGAVRTDTSTPATDVIALSAFSKDLTRHRLGGNSDVEVHPGPGPRTKGDDLNTLAATTGHIPDTSSGVMNIVSQVGYRKPAQDIAEFPFQYSIDTINQIHEGLVPGGLQPSADRHTEAPGAGVLGEPARPIAIPLHNKQVQANALQLVPHLPDEFIHSNDGQIKTGQTSPGKGVMEIDRLQNPRQVYERQIPDVQLQDPRATIICDAAPSFASQPPVHQVGNRCSPRQDDENTLQIDSVHVGGQLDGVSEIVPIEITRERFAPMVDQIPDSQMRTKTVTPASTPVPPSAAQLPGEQIQTRRKRNSLISDGLIHNDGTKTEYTFTTTLHSGPTATIAPFPRYPDALSPTAPSRRRKMQGMIDEANQDVADTILCGGPSSCLHAAPVVFRSPVQPSVNHTAEDAPFPNLGLGNLRTRRVGIASAQSHATVPMDGDPEWIASAATGQSQKRRSPDDELYQDLSAQTQPGSGRVKLVCFVWLLVFVLLGLLEFL